MCYGIKTNDNDVCRDSKSMVMIQYLIHSLICINLHQNVEYFGCIIHVYLNSVEMKGLITICQFINLFIALNNYLSRGKGL